MLLGEVGQDFQLFGYDFDALYQCGPSVVEFVDRLFEMVDYVCLGALDMPSNISIRTCTRFYLSALVDPAQRRDDDGDVRHCEERVTYDFVVRRADKGIAGEAAFFGISASQT